LLEAWHFKATNAGTNLVITPFIRTLIQDGSTNKGDIVMKHLPALLLAASMSASIYGCEGEKLARVGIYSTPDSESLQLEAGAGKQALLTEENESAVILFANNKIQLPVSASVLAQEIESSIDIDHRGEQINIKGGIEQIVVSKKQDIIIEPCPSGLREAQSVREIQSIEKNLILILQDSESGDPVGVFKSKLSNEEKQITVAENSCESDQIPMPPMPELPDDSQSPEDQQPEDQQPEDQPPVVSEPGRQDPGRQLPGRQEPGRQDPGRNLPGREQPGRGSKSTAARW
jgi:hypothetical protein